MIEKIKFINPYEVGTEKGINVIQPIKIRDDFISAIPEGNSCCPNLCRKFNNTIKKSDWITTYKPEKIKKLFRGNIKKTNMQITKIAKERKIFEDIRIEMYINDACKCVKKSGE